MWCFKKNAPQELVEAARQIEERADYLLKDASISEVVAAVRSMSAMANHEKIRTLTEKPTKSLSYQAVLKGSRKTRMGDSETVSVTASSPSGSGNRPLGYLATMLPRRS